MHLEVEGYMLRKPEPTDIEALYVQKNDPHVGALLGGFTTGYSKADLEEWLEYHRTKANEVLWVIVDSEDQSCVGHAGLYQIDYRIRSAEFAIMIGKQEARGKGLGRACTKSITDYGFEQLNLNRLQLSVLSHNQRAIGLYESLGFVREGRLRQAQYKNGRYTDVILMALLRGDWHDDP